MFGCPARMESLRFPLELKLSTMMGTELNLLMMKER